MDEQGGAGLSPRMILLVADARAQWAELDRRIAAFEAEFVSWAKQNEEARRLVTIPGVGALIASRACRRGRARGELWPRS
jgi:transposase